MKLRKIKINFQNEVGSEINKYDGGGTNGHFSPDSLCVCPIEAF